MPIPKDETNTERAISVAFNFRQKRHEYTCAQNLAAECGTQMQEIQKDWLEAERWVLTAERDVEAAEKELDAHLKEIGYIGSREAFVFKAMANWESRAVPMDKETFLDACDMEARRAKGKVQ